MDTDLFAAKEHKERKDSSLSAPFGERAWGEVSFSNFHVAAALLQLITDLLDELVGKAAPVPWQCNRRLVCRSKPSRLNWL